ALHLVEVGDHVLLVGSRDLEPEPLGRPGRRDETGHLPGLDLGQLVVGVDAEVAEGGVVHDLGMAPTQRPADQRDPPHRFWNLGGRFSKKARAPSSMSSVRKTLSEASSSAARPWSRGTSSARSIARFASRTATGPRSAMVRAIERATSIAVPAGATRLTRPIRSAW